MERTPAPLQGPLGKRGSATEALGRYLAPSSCLAGDDCQAAGAGWHSLPGACRSQRSPTRPTIPGQPPTPEVGLSHLPPDQGGTSSHLQSNMGALGAEVLSGGTMRHRVGAPSWGRPGWHREAAVSGHSLAPWAAPCCNLGTVGRHPPFLLQAWGAAAHRPCSRAGGGRGAGLSATLSAQGSQRAGALGSQRVFPRPGPQPGVSRLESGACQGPRASHGGGSP